MGVQMVCNLCGKAKDSAEIVVISHPELSSVTAVCTECFDPLAGGLKMDKDLATRRQEMADIALDAESRARESVLAEKRAAEEVRRASGPKSPATPATPATPAGGPKK